MAHDHRIPPAILALCLAGPPTAGASSSLHTDWSDDPQRLEDITIAGERELLDEAYWRLRQLLEAGAPCLGCDAQRAIARALEPPRFVRTNLMPEHNTVERFIFEVRCMDARPDNEYRC